MLQWRGSLATPLEHRAPPRTTGRAALNLPRSDGDVAHTPYPNPRSIAHMADSSAPIPGQLAPTLVAGRGGLPCIVLSTADGAEAEIYLHGAHIAVWIPAGDTENRLFLSERAIFGRGSAIRGGIPVVFPQFSELGPLAKHGFARTSNWSIRELERLATGGMRAVLELTASDETRAVWPHAFVAHLTLVIEGRTLHVELAVTNTGEGPFSFTAALHPYFRVTDAESADVVGLRGTSYRDAVAGNATAVEQGAALAIRGEVDRVFFDAPAELQLREPARTLHITKAGFPDAVVWNPGAAGTAGRDDFTPGDEQHMLCVEAGAIRRAVVLEPGTRWAGSQTITAA